MRTLKLFIAVLLTGMCLPTTAQDLSGRVIYEVTVDDSHIEEKIRQLTIDGKSPGYLEGYRVGAMNALAVRELTFETVFTPDRSVSRTTDTVPPPGMTAKVFDMLMIISGKTYLLLPRTEERIVEFLLKPDDEVVHLARPYDYYRWTIMPEETKTIAGYPCTKAIGTRPATETTHDGKPYAGFTAWFARDLPVPYGPMGFDGLPGLVLELTVDAPGGLTYRATKIILADDGADSQLPEMQRPPRVFIQEELDDYGRKLLKANGFNRN